MRAKNEKLQKFIQSKFALLESIDKKCQVEKEALKKRRFQFFDEMENIMKNKKLTNEAKEKRVVDIATKLHKSIEQYNMVYCQLKKCYKESIQMMKDYIVAYDGAKGGISRGDKRIAKYYTELLKKDKITVADLLNEENIRIQKRI